MHYPFRTFEAKDLFQGLGSHPAAHSKHRKQSAASTTWKRCARNGLLWILSTPPIWTFIRSTTSTVVTIPDLVHEPVLNVDVVFSLMSELRPVIQKALDDHRKDVLTAAARKNLPNFDIGDCVLVSRLDFFAGEKLALR